MGDFVDQSKFDTVNVIIFVFDFFKHKIQICSLSLFYKVKDTKNEEILLPLLLTQFFLICRCIAESQKKVNN